MRIAPTHEVKSEFWRDRLAHVHRLFHHLGQATVSQIWSTAVRPRSFLPGHIFGWLAVTETVWSGFVRHEVLLWHCLRVGRLLLWICEALRRIGICRQVSTTRER